MNDFDRRSLLRAAMVAAGAAAFSGCQSSGDRTIPERASRRRHPRVDVREFSGMQAALDAGVPLLIPKGVTVDHADGYLAIDPGTDVQVDGVLRKTGSPSGAGTRTSFLRNRHFDVPVDGLRIHGSGSIRAADHSMTGNLLALSGNDMRFTGFRIDCWAGGRALILNGDDVRCSGLDISGSPGTTGNGGIRVVGGRRFLGLACRVISGDDCLQFVPTGSSNDPLYDRSISGGRYLRCRGRSLAARFIAVGLQASHVDEGVRMAASITDVRFGDCRGVGGNRAAVVHNFNSSGVIDGVLFQGGSVDMGPSRAKVLRQEVDIAGAAGTGGVSHVVSEGWVIRHPRTRVLSVTGVTSNIDLPAIAS
jgi:hypothetical protein